ncbi:hypothetical protein [Paenibacillus pectinilyticus]|uniref:hypothetical protein n=1 Tax=Paenibacillus pectinilyticus TaxID=512399 RepID=UPI001ABEEE23|nr:hypothetical protein [Paenibacillus pectinilyticus]
MLIYMMYILYKSYRSFQVKKQVHPITLVGSSNYKKSFIMILFMVSLPFILGLDTNAKYGLLIVIVLINTLIDRVYLGDNGIKLSDEFIPKADIMSYYIVAGKVDQFELFVRGKENSVKITVHKRNVAESMEAVLAAWKPVS